MRFAGFWEKLGEAEGFFAHLLQFLLVSACLVCLAFFAVLPLSWPQQVVLGLFMLLIALWLGRSSTSYLVTLTLMLMSVFATLRYGWWRISTVAKFLSDPTVHWNALDAFFIVTLVLAESYAFVILALGYVQTIWPLRRAPVPLPEDIEEWPEIDLFIPTYNEPLSIVRHTVLASLNIDWPVEKLHVYLLDDGRRDEFRQFAEEAGVGYMIRENNKGAKAGNINAALARTNSPYVAIFDCDHVPTRSFLQVTMGWFLRDPKLGLLQTPHHFYSPDPFERNLDQFGAVPSEEELFYGVVQDGNDFWNATFFCGSCAVIRREALDEIGGIATETVTEDAHTSLRMQMRGWNTAYINIPQAAGLATERLAGHVTQRIRWARGMVQVLRLDNPLFAKGLSLSQRLCYFNAMMHFLYALPRLIFLTAPLIYLVLGHSNIPGYWAAILAYALPHLALANVTNSRVQGQHRHSFWNEIYETVLAPYIFLPTLLALINPKLGKFNVTAKGGTVDQTYFDVRIAKPFLVLLLFNLGGAIMAVLRFFWLDKAHPGTVVMNAVWVFFNIVILGVATAVAKESRQRRQDVRINIAVPSMVRLSDGRILRGESADISSGGAAIRLSEPFPIVPGESAKVCFPLPAGMAELPSTIIGVAGNLLRIRFENLTIREQEQLTVVLYSRADSWLGWGEAREADHPLRSLYRIFRLSLYGLRHSFSGMGSGTAAEDAKKLSASRAMPLLLAALLLPGMFSVAARAQAPAAGQSLAEAGSFHESFQLKDAGAVDPIEIRGLDGFKTLSFSLPDTQVVKQASVHVFYRFSPTLLPQLSHINLLLNGTRFATLQMPEKGTSPDALQDQTIAIPSDLLVHNNQLTFESVAHYAQSCEDPMEAGLWSKIDNASSIELTGSLLPLADDFSSLPAPFLETSLVIRPAVPIVFLEQPSKKSLQAAGIVAAYFGVIAESRGVRFPVSLGAIPPGNVVLLTSKPGLLPAELNLSTVSAPTLAIRKNPRDLYGKVLVITGANDEQLIAAAQQLALNSMTLRGSTVAVPEVHLPGLQEADAAPRWAQTGRNTRLWENAAAESLQGDGSTPLNTYFRIPPDLYYGDQQRVLLYLSYSYNSVPLAPNSELLARANRAYLGKVSLPVGTNAAQKGKAILPIDVTKLRPFSNSLAFEFNFQWPKRDNCTESSPVNMQGSILRDSYLDLRGVQHYAALPDLELFANAGFPYTRFADLHQTTAVLPQNPAPEEIELLLSMMAHFAAQTGFPGIRITVDDSSALHTGANQDFLVIGTAENQPAFGMLSDHLPVVMLGNKVRVQESKGLWSFLHHVWWKIRGEARDESDDLTDGEGINALVEGIESPYARGRSIVVIHGRDVQSYDAFLTSFFSVSQSSAISKSVSILRGSEFKSFRIGENVYHVGSLSRWTLLSLWFVQAPWLAALAVLVLCFLLAVWVRIWLRRRALARLHVVRR